MSDAAEPPRPHTVLLLPHQDDETGAFPLIRARLREGARVSVLYTTRGAKGDASPAAREAESRAVLTDLGVSPARVRFLGAELGVDDGAALACADVLLEGVRAALPAEDDLELVCPAWEGGHPDHDVTNLVVRRLRAEHPRVRAAWQFPLYHGAGVPRPFFRVLAPLPANGPVTRVPTRLGERLGDLRRCLRYPSQRVTWLGLFPFFLLRHLSGRVGSLQPVGPELPAGPPHAGPLYAERRGFVRREDLLDLLARWRSAIGTAPRPASGATPAGDSPAGDSPAGDSPAGG